jgi:esterase/lipase superfamily enzyme
MEFARAMPFCATRRVFLSGTVSAAALALGGCVTDLAGKGSLVQSAVAPPPGYNPTVLAVTNRQPAKGALKAPWYGHERSTASAFSQVVLNRPDTTLVGRARSGFMGGWSIGRVTPDSRPASEALLEAVAGREVLVYTHGYKESFESAAISTIELSDGVAFSGTPVLFTWPSRAALFDYGYDRESALYSRDAFEDMLLALLSEGGASRVHIVAHSMGTLLTVETLRQMWARHGDAMASRLGAIVLAAADIDFDLFENALKRLRTLVPRITVIASTADRALEVSRRLAGGVARTGAATREQLEALGVRVVDATEHGGWVALRHDLFLSDPDVRQVVRRSIERGRLA